MQTGFIFKLAEHIFGILTYQPQTQILCRVTSANTAQNVCHELGREFAGEFLVADADQAAYGKTLFRASGAPVLTQFQGKV